MYKWRGILSLSNHDLGLHFNIFPFGKLDAIAENILFISLFLKNILFFFFVSHVGQPKFVLFYSSPK